MAFSVFLGLEDQCLELIAFKPPRQGLGLELETYAGLLLRDVTFFNGFLWLLCRRQ